MPTGVLHLKEVDTDEITLDGTLSVSGASTLEGPAVTGSTLSVGGAATLADANAVNVNVSGTLSVGGQTTISGDIIPDTNDAYDIGSPEFKIRDMYVSDNSLWIGDTTKISNVGGRLKFRKRKTDATPQAILNAGLNAGYANETATTNAALSHAGVSELSQMRLQHWHRFMLLFNPQAKLTDIFRDTDDDYDETSASDAWKEINETKIYTDTNVGIGTSDPEAALHIRGAVKVENGFSLARNEGNDPSVIIDTKNFGLDETVNDLTGSGFNKYTKLYRVYGTNSQGVGKNWYWGYAQDDYTKFSLSFDGAGGNDPDIAFVFTTASEFHCNKVYAALSGNADTATKLQTARKINGVDFDGTADITIPMSQGTIQIGPLNDDHLYLASANEAWGWKLDTVDQGNGAVPFRIKKRTNSVDTTVLTIKNENGYVGIGGSENPTARLTVFNSITSSDTSIPAANMGEHTAFPNSTSMWIANKHSGYAPYWGLAIGTIWTGASYLQNLNKRTNTYYDLLFQPNGGNVVIGGTSTYYDQRFQVDGGSARFASDQYSLSQGKRYHYNFKASGNNNHELTIPINGSSYRGIMKLKIIVTQVAPNSSAESIHELEGTISAYGGTHVIKAIRATYPLNRLNAQHECSTSSTSSGNLKIFYEPYAGHQQLVACTFDVELVLGASFAHAGSLSHVQKTSAYGVGEHGFYIDRFQLDGYKAFTRNINMTANNWVGVTNYNNDLTTGTYMMSVYIHTAGIGGVLYEETYSGLVQWYSGQTNSTNSSTIDLHNSGHADNNEVIEMRTRRHGHGDGVHLQLQIKSNYSWSQNLRFCFRRLM